MACCLLVDCVLVNGFRAYFDDVLLIVLFCFTLFVGYYCFLVGFVCYFDVWHVDLFVVLLVVVVGFRWWVLRPCVGCCWV